MAAQRAYLRIFYAVALACLAVSVQPCALGAQPASAPDKSAAAPEKLSRYQNDSGRVAQTVVMPQGVTGSSESKSWIDLIVGLAIALAWPLAVIGLLILVIRSEQLKGILERVANRGMKFEVPGGISLEIGRDEAAKQNVYFQGSFKDLTSNAEAQYEQMKRAARINDYLNTVVECAFLRALKKCIPETTELPGEFRATVHVPDIIFGESLYQLVDYYTKPKTEKPTGHGRRFSMRYGIIGRAWRLSESVGEGDAVDPPSSDASAADKKKWEEVKNTLIREWGMFPKEAERGSHGRPSYLCVILKAQVPQGVLFIDSTIKEAFGTKVVAQAVADALEIDDDCKALSRQIGEIMTTLRMKGPHLMVEEG